VTPEPYPEAICGRLDLPSARWTVEAGAVGRGEAWTDLADRRMRVPLDGGAHGRVVRAHELMHARISPAAPGLFDAFDGVPARSVECAEEFRVNHLLGRCGFELTELRDGSERLTGRRLADAGDWAELVRFAAAVSGTPALSDLLRGVRAIEPSWARACRALERELLRVARAAPTSALASTTPSDRGLVDGFAVFTDAFARVVPRHVDAPPDASATTPARRRHRPAPTGAFAPLVVDHAVVLDRVVRGGLAPRRVAAACGRRVVSPARLVTDPARRIFEQRGRGPGGVVVVDQSGSMALSAGALAELLVAAPGAFVLGYSHAPGSTGVPNAWVLADRGRAASKPRAGNVGNGVDAPALRYALGRRRVGEPLVWVCDGQVTDAGDHADPVLAAECARLALRHGIVMVATVPEALAALRRPSRRPRLLGRVAAAVTASP